MPIPQEIISAAIAVFLPSFCRIEDWVFTVCRIPRHCRNAEP
ncbi:MAG: hypothetical protein ACKO5Q_02105 [Microcystaceae cyanobacterium]